MCVENYHLVYVQFQSQNHKKVGQTLQWKFRILLLYPLQEIQPNQWWTCEIGNLSMTRTRRGAVRVRCVVLPRPVETTKVVCYNSFAKLCTALSLLLQYSYSKFCTKFLSPPLTSVFSLFGFRRSRSTSENKKIGHQEVTRRSEHCCHGESYDS